MTCFLLKSWNSQLLVCACYNLDGKILMIKTVIVFSQVGGMPYAIPCHTPFS